MEVSTDLNSISKSPLKSHGFWGFLLAIVIPGILTLIGANDSNIAQLTSDFVNIKPIDYSSVDWVNVSSQVVGGGLSLYGLLNPKRKPLKF